MRFAARWDGGPRNRGAAAEAWGRISAVSARRSARPRRGPTPVSMAMAGPYRRRRRGSLVGLGVGRLPLPPGTAGPQGERKVTALE